MNKTTYDNTLGIYRHREPEDVARALSGQAERRGQAWCVPCPAHGGDGLNLHIFESRQHGLAVKCHSQGCSTPDIWQAIHERLGWEKPAEEQGVPHMDALPEPGQPLGDKHPGFVCTNVYGYARPDGHAHAAVVRYENGLTGRKELRAFFVSREGKWIPRSPKTRHLYRANWIEDWRSTGHPLLIVEGEKCADAANQAWGDRLVATTWMGGADSLDKSRWQHLHRWTGPVWLWPDNDVPGIRSMHTLGDKLSLMGLDVRWIKPWGTAGHDVADYLDIGPGDWPEHMVGEFESDGAYDSRGRLWDALPTVEEACLEAGVEMRYNLRSSRHQWRPVGAGPEDWADLEDDYEARLRVDIEASQSVPGRKDDESVPLHYSDQRWNLGKLAWGFDNKADAFLEWVQSCGQGTDGGGSHGLLLETAFDIPEEYGALAKWSSRYLFLGAIHRAVEPGCQVDEVPVLMGGQGLGKGSILQYLFPDQWRRQWFFDGLDLHSDRKVFTEAMQGRVLVEFSEMSWSDKASLERLKSLITSRDDGGVRMAYARNTRDMPRMSIFVGTANGLNPLPPDPTGYRRWVAVHLTGARFADPSDMMDWLDQNRADMWADAWKAYQAGDRPRLPRRLFETQAVINERHVAESEYLEGALVKALSSCEDQFTLHDLLKKANIWSGERMDHRALGATLRSWGCTSTKFKREGKWIRGWQKPPRDWNNTDPQ